MNSSQTAIATRPTHLVDHEQSQRSSKEKLRHLEITWIHHPDFDNADTIHCLMESMSADDFSDTQSSPVMKGQEFTLPNRKLLSAADERMLFLTFNLHKCLAERRRLQALSPKGTQTDVRTVHILLDQATEIRNRIMESNQRLVVSLATRFAGRNSPLSDMISEANLTLLKAIQCFDAGKGFRFSTYATYAIRRHLSRLQQREQKRAMVCGEDLPDPVLDDELPEWLDVHPGQLVRQVISELPKREQQIISLRFGFESDGRKRTYAEIAAAFGISKERVRQLIVKSCQDAFQRHGERLGFAG